MSLEQRLELLEQAVNRNTEAHEALIELLKNGKAPAPATTKPTTTKAAATKSAKSTAKSTKSLQPDDLRKAFGGFLGQAKTADEQKALNAPVKRILTHLGAQRVQQIKPEDAQKSIDLLKELQDHFAQHGYDGLNDFAFSFEPDAAESEVESVL